MAAENTREVALCNRCNARPTTIKIRSDPACDPCFCQYVTTKIIKRMETLRMHGSGSGAKAPRKLLVPLSFGASSTSLLSVLDNHLQSQQNRLGRVAYTLHGVHVDMLLEEGDRAESRARMDQIKQRYFRHTYSLLGLEEAIRLGVVDCTILEMGEQCRQSGSAAPSQILQDILGALPSASSRSDMISILLRGLLVQVARSMECEAILFGDSTTRLAERTLLETAQGRGFSLPWQVSDGMSPYGVFFHYPVRDVLRREVVAFTEKTSPTLAALVTPQEASINVTASAKTTTINDLLSQYFESVEVNYPSIVANVVRTTGKLDAASTMDSTACRLCQIPVTNGTEGIYGWPGDQTLVSLPVGHQQRDLPLCYGCSRSIHD